MAHQPLAKEKRKIVAVAPLACVHPHAAGMDLSVDEIVVAVPPDRDDHPVRAFGTFTVDLHRLATWLEQCGIETVVMESTGVLWIPLFEVLERRGIHAQLVNARYVKARKKHSASILIRYISCSDKVTTPNNSCFFFATIFIPLVSQT